MELLIAALYEVFHFKDIPMANENHDTYRNVNNYNNANQCYIITIPTVAISTSNCNESSLLNPILIQNDTVVINKLHD